MNKTFTLLLAALTLALAPLHAGQARLMSWKTISVTAEDSTIGKVSVKASTNGRTYQSFVINVFGKDHSLGKEELKKLAGFPLDKMYATHEESFRTKAGITLNIHLVKPIYKDHKPAGTNDAIVMISKKEPIQILHVRRKAQ